jgi:hypothetical protein
MIENPWKLLAQIGYKAAMGVGAKEKTVANLLITVLAFGENFPFCTGTKFFPDI